MRAILVVLSMVAGGGKTPAPSDFTIPALPDLPKADNLQAAPSDERKLDTPTADVPKREYEVVKVSHAQSFEARGDSYIPRKEVNGFDVVNLPMVLPAFSTLVRVRSPQQVGAPIELRIVDPQGREVLSSSGTLVFGGQPTSDYVVDWSPIKIERSGDYVVEVKVDGKPISKSPLPIRHELRASISETQATPALKAALVPTQPTTGGKTDPAAPDPYDVTR
jgi:hypothetical protein